MQQQPRPRMMEGVQHQLATTDVTEDSAPPATAATAPTDTTMTTEPSAEWLDFLDGLHGRKPRGKCVWFPD